MTIYVDELQTYQQKATSGGRYFGSGKQSCHMMTDGEPEELHQFAEQIGLRRAWYQNHPRHPHYDLTPSKRARAVYLGAQEISAMEWARQRLAKSVPARPCDSCGDPTGTKEDYQQLLNFLQADDWEDTEY
jgi:hypothetical protein